MWVKMRCTICGDEAEIEGKGSGGLFSKKTCISIDLIGKSERLQSLFVIFSSLIWICLPIVYEPLNRPVEPLCLWYLAMFDPDCSIWELLETTRTTRSR